MAEAVRRGAVEIFLEVAEPNAAARALYACAGAREVGRRPRYYADGADALVLRIDLPRPMKI
jgi:ribosomal-protein-alanine N-acetyltransferase